MSISDEFSRAREEHAGSAKKSPRMIAPIIRTMRRKSPTRSMTTFAAAMSRWRGNSPNWRTTDSLSRKVGAAPAEKFAKITHAVPMLSLGNIFSDDELVEFVARVKRFLGARPEDPLAFTAEPKIDGLSCNPALRKRRSGQRRDARRRFCRRGRDRQRPNNRRRSAKSQRFAAAIFWTCAAKSI